MDEPAFFRERFQALTGNVPFGWQERLYDELVGGRLDAVRAVDIPTGLGKTAIIPIWLLALAGNPALPRRLVYVVDRRTVVDQATEVAEKMRRKLLHPAG